MDATVRSLVSFDARLEQHALSAFPRSPALVHFLVEQMRVHNGSLDVLKTICRSIKEIYEDRPPPEFVLPSTVKRWSGPLRSAGESRDLSRSLARIFDGLYGQLAVMTIQLRTTPVRVNGVVVMQARPSSNGEEAEVYGGMFLRTLAILEELERPLIH